MRDFNTKADDTAGSQGQVVADEYNSLFDEVKNTITVFGTPLSEADSKQMQKAMDIAVKANNYEDGGTVNSVELTRPITSETTETLFDGMVVYFSPKFENTGATTLKITTLLAKPLKYLSTDLVSGFLKTDSNYKAIYDSTNGHFEVDIIANSKNLQDAEYDTNKASYDNDAMSYIPNTLASGAILEQGLNAFGSYIKLVNGLIFMFGTDTANPTVSGGNYFGSSSGQLYVVNKIWSFPHALVGIPLFVGAETISQSSAVPKIDGNSYTSSAVNFTLYAVSNTTTITYRYYAIGWYK